MQTDERRIVMDLLSAKRFGCHERESESPRSGRSFPWMAFPSLSRPSCSNSRRSRASYASLSSPAHPRGISAPRPAMAETEPAPVEVPQVEEPAAVIEDATAVEDGAAGTKRKLDDVEPTGEEDPHIAKRPSFNGPEATENGVEVRARKIRAPAASYFTVPDCLVTDGLSNRCCKSSAAIGHFWDTLPVPSAPSLPAPGEPDLIISGMHAFNACFAVMPVKSEEADTSTDRCPSRPQEAPVEEAEAEEPAPGVDAPPGVEAAAAEPAPTEEPAPVEEAVPEAAAEPTAIPELTPEQQLAEQQRAAAAVLAAAVAPVAAAVDPYPQAVTQQPAAINLQGLTQVIHISSGMVGKLIGKSGETIKGLQFSTNARIQARHSPPGPRVHAFQDTLPSQHVPDQALANMSSARSNALMLEEHSPSSEIIVSASAQPS